MPVTRPWRFRHFVSLSWLTAHHDAVLFSGSSVLKTLAQFAASLVVVRFVGPKELGLWTTVSLATTYALLLQDG